MVMRDAWTRNTAQGNDDDDDDDDGLLTLSSSETNTETSDAARETAGLLQIVQTLTHFCSV